MKRLLITLSVVLLSCAAASAQEDPVAVRKALMQANAASAGAASAMMRGEMDYNPAVALAALATFRAVSLSVGSFFPEGSDSGETRASPRIWEDMAGFQQEIADFQADAAAAREAAGREGPADLAAFQSMVEPVLAHCNSCHETYRTEN
ncbi:cytochrome c [Chelativorans sp. Marseille-P2723]|uniref:c-type cytochrome n=1 Tax=Chelativorans sp. Marseille-P2723 TaxID=2709133 RepID=UPI0015705C29|nr:cytochrome c [Chelativorans sp. Marseille-P2723]